MNQELKKYYEQLGISDVHLNGYSLPFCLQANLDQLEVVDIDFSGRAFVIHAAVTRAWREMVSNATADEIILRPASGFRSYLYQAKLIERQLGQGRTIEEILTGNAIPGFSEHHTGRAIDIIKDPSIPEDAFHETDTFQWMLENAGRFGFRLSYPRENPHGMIFEPWHWYFQN